MSGGEIKAENAVTADDLMQVEGVGDVIAASVVGYFQNTVNQEIIARLKTYGPQISSR